MTLAELCRAALPVSDNTAGSLPLKTIRAARRRQLEEWPAARMDDRRQDTTLVLLWFFAVGSTARETPDSSSSRPAIR
jgi:hypothetical protein